MSTAARTFSATSVWNSWATACSALSQRSVLFAKHPNAPEGELTRIRALLVCEDSLHEVAQRLELGQYLKLGNGEEGCGGRTRPSILADATEAVFAAVYLDGGISAASALIHRVLLDTEREEVAEEKRRDYKTLLQEFVQRTPNQHALLSPLRRERTRPRQDLLL